MKIMMLLSLSSCYIANIKLDIGVWMRTTEVDAMCVCINRVWVKKINLKNLQKKIAKFFLITITHKSNKEIILNYAPDARAQQNIFVLVFYSVQTLLYSKSNQCLPLPIHVTSKVLLESHCVQFQGFRFGKADIAFRSHYIIIIIVLITKLDFCLTSYLSYPQDVVVF